MVERALVLKHERKQQNFSQPCVHKTLIMIFEKLSTRTRISFEIAMQELGGRAIFLSSQDSQLSRGESAEDSARVLSRMCDGLVIRTHSHDRLEKFAAYSKVPIINGLTDKYHPCQVLADVMTWQELRGDIQGKTLAWIGDGNNMCNSYINAAMLFNFQLRIACPSGYAPDNAIIRQNKTRIAVVSAPEEAVEQADVVVTDVWASMGTGSREQRAIPKVPGLSSQCRFNATSQRRCDFHALPAGASWRRSQRRSPGRRPQRRLGGSRESLTYSKSFIRILPDSRWRITSYQDHVQF